MISPASTTRRVTSLVKKVKTFIMSPLAIVLTVAKAAELDASARLEVADRDRNDGSTSCVCDLPAAPLSRNPLQVSRPEALRPRLATGLPLRCRHSDAPSQSTPQAPVCTDGGWFAVYLSRVSAVTPIV